MQQKLTDGGKWRKESSLPRSLLDYAAILGI